MKTTIRFAAAGLLALGFAGCALFGGGSSSGGKSAHGLPSGIQKVVTSFARAVKVKLWSDVSPLLVEDASVAEDLKARTQALWGRGQIVDLRLEVLSVSKEGENYDARVKWSSSILGDNGLTEDSGKCDFYMRRTETGFLVFRIEGNAFL